jgi:hypothetical protein
MGDIADYHYDIVLDELIEEAVDTVHCPYCHKQAEQVTGDIIYPHRPDLKKRLFYRCKPCGAYVGCHERSGEPYGTLANAELRGARNEAHMFFDKLWKFSWSGMTRNQAYKWLRKALGCPKADCHIGMFSIKQCKKTSELARLKLEELSTNTKL